MGFPAARMTDMHVCPMCPVPPGLPIVMPCMPNVLIGYMPAARMTDLCVCIPPPPLGGDAIITGAFNVLVGGLPAARMTDLTAKGGTITTGFPTVLIGMNGVAPPPVVVPAPPPFPVTTITLPNGDEATQFGDSIIIEGSEEFRNGVVGDLQALANTPTGESMINSIQDSGNTVTIKEAANSRGNGCGYDTPDARFENADGNAGAGTSATVHYYPHDHTLADGSEPWMDTPKEVVLGHELVHAEQATNGRQHRGETDGTRNRERQAVGLPPYENNAHSENQIREDMGLPARERY